MVGDFYSGYLKGILIDGFLELCMCKVEDNTKEHNKEEKDSGGMHFQLLHFPHSKLDLNLNL